MRRSAAWLSATALVAVALYAGMSAAPEGRRQARPTASPDPGLADRGPRVSVTGCEELGIVSAQLSPSYRTSFLGSFELSLSSEGEMHVSDEYPTFVSLSGSESISLVDAELGRERARATDNGLAFDVAFTPSRDGAHDVDVRVEYALCTDSACIPSTCRFHVTVNSVA